MDVEDGRYGSFSNRPDAAILSYPVITSADKAHRGSFQALLGMDAAEEELEYMSLEKQVSPQTPPCFLWQTATDEAVPVETATCSQRLEGKRSALCPSCFFRGTARPVSGE